MNIFQLLRQAEDESARFRELERILELPKNSVKSEYQRTLILRGVDYKEAERIEAELREIAITVPHSYNTVIKVYDHIKSIERTKQILEHSCRAIVNVDLILGLIPKQ
jgi:hypothetical protein